MYGVIPSLILSTLLSPVKSEAIHDPTIIPDPTFSASSAAGIIFREVHIDVFTDEDRIARIIFHLSVDQQIELSDVYTRTFGDHSLPVDLKSISSGNMALLYYDAFTRPEMILAKEIYMAINNGFSSCVEETMCAQDNHMKSLIQESYLSMYLTELEEEFKKYNADDRPYQEAMMKYCWPPREEQLKINEKVATDEAKALKGLLNDSDKEKFKCKLKEYLGKYTEGDLKLIFQKYRDDKRGIDNDVDDIFEGYEKIAYSTLVKYIENTCKYYADALHHAVEDGFGQTDILSINRITQTRCERDMMCIANTYKGIHGKTFTQRLKNDLFAEDRYLECIRILCGKKSSD